MDRLKVIENHVAAVTETVSSAFVPPLQLTEGQPPPIAANGGLSYMSFDRDGDGGTAAATEAALIQTAEKSLQAIIDMLDNAPPGPIETKWGVGFRGNSECLDYIRANNIEAPEGGVTLPLHYTIAEQSTYSIVSSNALWRDPAREAEAKALRNEEQNIERRCLYFPQVMRDARRMEEYHPGLLPNSPECMDKLGVSLAHCESECENFYDAAEVERVFYPEMEKLLLEFFPDATDALVYNHDVFDKDYEGDRTEDQDNKNPGVNANYANLVHNDLNDNSGPRAMPRAAQEEPAELRARTALHGGAGRREDVATVHVDQPRQADGDRAPETPSCSAPGPLSPTSRTSPTTGSTTTASARPPASPTAPTTSGTGFPSRSPPKSRCSSATTLSQMAPSRAGLSTLPASTQPRPTTLPAARTSWSDPMSSSK